MQESLCRTLRINKKVVDPKSGANVCGAGAVLPPPHFPNIAEQDVAMATEDAVVPPGESAEERGMDMKASERLEKFISNMMKKAELLNTTREEQILKKQQILEELQKVEAELHEKAKAQLLLNVEQKQRSQQQQLLQQQVQLAAAAMQQQQGAAAVAGAGGDKGKGAPSFHSLLKNQLELTKKAVLNMGKSDSAESSVSSTNCAEGYAGGGGAGAGGEAEKPALAKQESLGSASSMSADSGCGNSDNNCLGREGAGQPDGMEARGDGKGDGRAGSEDVDLSNVMPFRDQKQAEGDDTDTGRFINVYPSCLRLHWCVTKGYIDVNTVFYHCVESVVSVCTLGYSVFPVLGV